MDTKKVKINCFYEINENNLKKLLNGLGCDIIWNILIGNCDNYFSKFVRIFQNHIKKAHKW